MTKRKKGRDRSRPFAFKKSWMAGSSPAMTMGGAQFEARFGGEAGHDLIRVS
jgi:hypothetical protein